MSREGIKWPKAGDSSKINGEDGVNVGGKWSIGEVAKLFNVSTDTLRFYEKEGILSALKNEGNGYRHYSYNEIVVLMDILFFRNMELSVKDIKQIVTNMDIGSIKELLYENQKIVGDRIQELIRLQKMIARVASHYEICEQWLGKFQVVPAPDFKYKLLNKQEDDLIEMIQKYKQGDWSWMDSIRYTLVIPQEELLKTKSFLSARSGISLDRDKLHHLAAEEQQELSSLTEGEYLYTVIGTNYREQEHTALSKTLRYLAIEGREVQGPLLARYMASSHKDALDYYELWIAVHKS